MSAGLAHSSGAKKLFYRVVQTLRRFRLRSSRSNEASLMRIRNSLKAAKTRDKNCRVVRRRGRVYVINKKNPRMKARQG